MLAPSHLLSRVSVYRPLAISPAPPHSRDNSKEPMQNPVAGQPAQIHLSNTSDYRETYANSVQVRVNLWDFFLMFGTIQQTVPEVVNIHNFQGVYLSPQQAKALSNLLNQNIAQYESAFGEIRLEPIAGDKTIQ
jgi:flagellar protein FlaG